MNDCELRFKKAVDDLTVRVGAVGVNVEDEDTEAEVRRWLNGSKTPPDWSGLGITPDEWFFVTTLYGTMTQDGQRTHICANFPRFVQEARRDMRLVTGPMVEPWPLRSPWMKTRLRRMADVLRQRGQTMAGYTAFLRQIESKATPSDPMPALDQIVKDHQAGAYKTISVFIRDCVKGNCFPIDSRVAKQLAAYNLPADERRLVSLCLGRGLNPRKVARIFYQAETSEQPPFPVKRCG